MLHLKPVIKKKVLFSANEHTFFSLHRHHLEHSFHSDSETAMLEADVIGVVYDVSNTWTRDRLDPKVLRMLYLYPKKHSFLILNKVRFMSCSENCHKLSRKKQSFTCSSTICSSHITLCNFFNEYVPSHT